MVRGWWCVARAWCTFWAPKVTGLGFVVCCECGCGPLKGCSCISLGAVLRRCVLGRLAVTLAAVPCSLLRSTQWSLPLGLYACPVSCILRGFPGSRRIGLSLGPGRFRASRDPRVGQRPRTGQVVCRWSLGGPRVFPRTLIAHEPVPVGGAHTISPATVWNTSGVVGNELKASDGLTSRLG